MARVFFVLAVTAATLYSGYQAIDSAMQSADLAVSRMQAVEQMVNGQ